MSVFVWSFYVMMCLILVFDKVSFFFFFDKAFKILFRVFVVWWLVDWCGHVKVRCSLKLRLSLTSVCWACILVLHLLILGICFTFLIYSLELLMLLMLFGLILVVCLFLVQLDLVLCERCTIINCCFVR